MPSAIDSALSGLNNASARIEQSARAIARNQPQVQSPTSTDSAPITASLTDNADELVKIQVATYDFKANLKSIRAADEVLQSLLDIKA